MERQQLAMPKGQNTHFSFEPTSEAPTLGGVTPCGCTDFPPPLGETPILPLPKQEEISPRRIGVLPILGIAAIVLVGVIVVIYYGATNAIEAESKRYDAMYQENMALLDKERQAMDLEKVELEKQKDAVREEKLKNSQEIETQKNEAQRNDILKRSALLQRKRDLDTSTTILSSTSTSSSSSSSSSTEEEEEDDIDHDIFHVEPEADGTCKCKCKQTRFTIGASSPDRVPVNTPFSAYQSRPYKVWGNFSENVGFPLSFTEPALPFFGIFIPGQGYYLNQVVEIGGEQWTLPNGTYLNQGFDTTVGQCYFSIFGTLANEILALDRSVAKIGELGKLDYYAGYPDSFGSCGQGAGEEFLVNPKTNTIVNILYQFFAPLNQEDYCIFNTTTTAGLFTVTKTELLDESKTYNLLEMYPLPTQCASINVTDPATNFCAALGYGLTCFGYAEVSSLGQSQCVPKYSTPILQ